MIDPTIFGFRLRHVREERGMSQTVLASGICSPSAVSRWESGHCVPSGEIIVQLAHRLGLPPEVLTRRDFNSRLLTSGDGFGDLVEAAFESFRWIAEGSSMASWISRARFVFRHVDPWLSGPDLRPIVDDLAVDPFTASVPISLETVELLDAMLRVKETTDSAAINALTETLSWTVDAPAIIRQAALETVVAVLVNNEMPIAARGAVIRTDPPEITATTAALLTLGGAATEGLPQVAGNRSARDVAFGVLSRMGDMQAQDRRRVAAVLVDSCPKDGLVAMWASGRGRSPD